MIWSGRSIGEQNRGIKRVAIYCWVRGLSSKYICIYGVLRASVSPQFQLEWDHWILGAPAPWGAISWSRCPVWRCQCAPPAGLALACRAVQWLGARYWGSLKSGRDREQKICQLAERVTHRSRPTSADTMRSQAWLRAMFVCAVCARGTSHCKDGLLSMSAVVEPGTRSPLCSLSSGSTHSTFVLARTRNVKPHLYWAAGIGNTWAIWMEFVCMVVFSLCCLLGVAKSSTRWALDISNMPIRIFTYFSSK